MDVGKVLCGCPDWGGSSKFQYPHLLLQTVNSLNLWSHQESQSMVQTPSSEVNQVIS